MRDRALALEHKAINFNYFMGCRTAQNASVFQQCTDAYYLDRLTLSYFPDDFLCWGLQADKTNQILLLTALAYSWLSSEFTCTVCWAMTHLIVNVDM